MKKNSILWAVLPMMAAALLTAACASDDSTDETPAGQSAEKTIPYTVTVGQGEAADTRATVDADLMTLKFANGDKLYVTGTNIKGVLNIQTGTGTASATFSGNLTYSGSGTPADNLQLTATLVSAQQTVGTQVSVNDAGAVTVNYPTTAYCANVDEAVQKYSNLTGTSTYGTKSFTLSQQTAFLNFVVTAGDGSSVSAVVSNGGVAICTANVTPTTENSKSVAKFVLPVASGTTLSSATVKVGENDALTITNATLTGKVYNVDKMPARDLTEVTTTDVGKIVGKDGKIYNTKAAAEAVATGNAVAMIAYVGTASGFSHGLAIALEDVSTNKLTWDNSGSNNDNETATGWCSGWNTDISKKVTGGTWKLPYQDEWKQMFSANGGSESSYTGLNTAIGSAGGTALQEEDSYWSSSEDTPGSIAYDVLLYNGSAGWYTGWENEECYVRACLAF